MIDCIQAEADGIEFSLRRELKRNSHVSSSIGYHMETEVHTEAQSHREKAIN